MILLPLYAGLIWFLSLRWRRTWKGYAAAMGGGILILLFIPVLFKLQLLVKGIDARTFSLILWAEGVIVLTVGLFIASMPRRDRKPHCHYCGYDLSGHSSEQKPVCPECGVPFDGYASQRQRTLTATEVKQAIAARKEALEHEMTNPELASQIIRRISTMRAAGFKALEHDDSAAPQPPQGPDQQDQQRQPEGQAPADGAELRR